MSIWVYNTASGKKEEFIPREKGVVSAYVAASPHIALPILAMPARLWFGMSSGVF